MAGLDLGDQQAWLRAVLDLLPFPALLVEPGTGRILFANRSAGCAPPGLRGAEEAGPGGPGATDPEGVPIPPEELPHRRAARGERLDGVRITWSTPGGPASFAAFSGTVPAMHGHAPLAVLTYLDVTRLMATEADLRRAVRVRDEFFSVATHELKDPLASLLLSVEVLLRLSGRPGSIPADLLARQLEVGKRQADRLGRMIENLLDVSRISAGRLSLDVEALDLSDLVREVAGRFDELARAAGVTLTVEPAPPTIGYFDRMKLEQVVGNLISNAIKYGAGRPVALRLRSDPTTAVLEVEDHGIGIAEADRARVFERFERATASQSGKSLGLGLYIVRSIVEAHGGTIGLRSEPGRGSTFVVTLPRKRLPRRDEGEATREG